MVPSYQAIYDLSDLDVSLFMAYSEVSGHFKSPNLTEMLARGERVRLNPSARTAAHTLTLAPAPDSE